MEKIELKDGVVYKFDPQIYPRKLWIAVSTALFKERFSNVLEFDESEIALTGNVHDDIDNLGGLFIRFENIDAIKFEVVTHEAIHAVLGTYDYCGVSVDTRNQEHLCYFAGWVAKCCGEVLRAEQERTHKEYLKMRMERLVGNTDIGETK